MDKEFKRAYADAYPDRLPDYVTGRWSHVCADGNMQWCRHGEHCGICLKREDDGLGHHGPKDRDRIGPGAVPRRPTGDHTMNLRDKIARRLCVLMDDDWFEGKRLYRSEADAILALVREHLTSEAALERADSAYVVAFRKWSSTKQLHRAAITAALGEGE